MASSSILSQSTMGSAYARFLAKRAFADNPDVLARFEELRAEHPELKVTDFLLQKGSATCRVVSSEGVNVGIRLASSALTQTQWDTLIELLSEKSYFAAQLLAGKLPTEIADLAEEHQIPLIPAPEALVLQQDMATPSEPSPEIAAFFMKLSDTLEHEPCAYLMFRGNSPQEVLAELRKKRLTQTAERRRPTAITEIAYPSPSGAQDDLSKFWNMSKDIQELQYTIKADELPASILKWLAPIPLDGVEDLIDHNMEEAYARIARLAQGFGLGL